MSETRVCFCIHGNDPVEKERLTDYTGERGILLKRQEQLDSIVQVSHGERCFFHFNRRKAV